MNDSQRTTLTKVREFLCGTTEVNFSPLGDDASRYRFVAGVLRRFAYKRLAHADKGLIRRYLERTTGYSRAQVARLLRRHGQGGDLRQRYAAPKAGFRRRYTAADVALRAEVDTWHGRPTSDQCDGAAFAGTGVVARFDGAEAGGDQARRSSDSDLRTADRSAGGICAGYLNRFGYMRTELYPALRSLLRNRDEVPVALGLMLAWMASIDGQLADSEVRVVRRAAREQGVSDLVDAMLALAGSRDAAALQWFAEVLRHHFSAGRSDLPMRLAISVAIADRRLLAAENHLLRFLADLQGLSRRRWPRFS